MRRYGLVPLELEIARGCASRAFFGVWVWGSRQQSSGDAYTSSRNVSGRNRHDPDRTCTVVGLNFSVVWNSTTHFLFDFWGDSILTASARGKGLYIPITIELDLVTQYLSFVFCVYISHIYPGCDPRSISDSPQRTYQRVYACR